MKIPNFPEPPNPSDMAYKQNPALYNLAMYRWATVLKSQLQLQSQTNDRPTNQAFQATNFTLTTSITGTATTSTIANFVCSLVSALQSKGILPQVSSSN